MMTREKMWEMFQTLGNDLCVWEDSIDEDPNGFRVTLNDFEGFDENWEEIDRDYDDEDAVDAFLEMLETECVSKEGDFYVTYHFDGFDVELGYESFNI